MQVLRAASFEVGGVEARSLLGYVLGRILQAAWRRLFTRRPDDDDDFSERGCPAPRQPDT
jgi:hypothetical protein